MNMKFAILLLALFIPLFTSTSARICYQCLPGTDCSSNGIKKTCTDSAREYCFTTSHHDTKQVYIRACVLPTTPSTDLKPGCQIHTPSDNVTLDVCYCNSDLCNGANRQNGHTKIVGFVGMSLTTLLGGVLALLLMK